MNSDGLDTPYPVDPSTLPPPTDPNHPANTPGGTSYETSVQRVYQAYYGRPGTPQELASMFSQYGGNLEAITNAIVASPEAKAYGNFLQPKTTETGTTITTPPPTPPPTVSGPPQTKGTDPNSPVPGPTYTPPPAFKYDDFQDPTGQDVLNDPGYKFDYSQGIDAIGKKNAALGTLNTGGTIGDFMRYGTDLAHAKYGDIWQRKLSDYSTNRANAFQNYQTNYQTQTQDPYSISQHNYDQNKAFDFNSWIQQYQMSRNNQMDAFDRQYKWTGLL